MDREVSESLIATARVLESVSANLLSLMAHERDHTKGATLSACVVALARLAGAHRKAAQSRVQGDDYDFHREEDARERAAGRED
jgi:hypothetical protein